MSHLHNDHAGGVRHFTDLGVPSTFSARELEYGLSDHPVPEQSRHVPVDYDDRRHNWRLADGDARLGPGITAVLSPGHTPGHQSFVVDLDESAGGGGFVFAFDAADLAENIDDEARRGWFHQLPPAGHGRPDPPPEGHCSRARLPGRPGPRPHRVVGANRGARRAVACPWLGDYASGT